MGLNDVRLKITSMVTIYDVPADALIEEVAARLEDRIDAVSYTHL
ncbi:30S ribosomal protein S19e, partial [Halorubrum kocurii JCM 14978]